jgi:hypothetical protein
MNHMSAWVRLLRAVVANEPDLPALRPCVLRLQTWILDPGETATASRELRHRRTLRFLGASPSRSARPRAGRASRSVRRAA